MYIKVLKENLEEAAYVTGLCVVFSLSPGKYWNSNLRGPRRRWEDNIKIDVEIV
jgi:hypothetical protein